MWGLEIRGKTWLTVGQKAGHRIWGRQAPVPALPQHGPQLPGPGQFSGILNSQLSSTTVFFLRGSGFSERTY